MWHNLTLRELILWSTLWVTVQINLARAIAGKRAILVLYPSLGFFSPSL